jgi:predicted permease
MESLLQDLRHGLRVLLRRPVVTLAAVLSLGLGIGANTAIFSLANAVLWRQPPVADPGRLVTLFTKDVKNPGFGALSRLNWQDYREMSRSFSGILGYQWTALNVQTGGEPVLSFGQLASANYFEVLGVRPALGRGFRPEEDGEGAHPVAVLSHRFWQERLGGDPAVLGRKLTINGSGYTVIGVAPEGFTGPDVGLEPQLWVPMSMYHQVSPNVFFDWYHSRRAIVVSSIGRLKPGVTLAAAQGEIGKLAKNLERDYPDDNKGRGVELMPLLQSSIPPQIRQGLLNGTGLLLVVTGLVLLIACSNVSNLLLAQASARRREIAIRLSQGAGRGRLIRQLLTESVLLALLGGAFGLLVSVWMQGILPKLLPQGQFPVKVVLPLDARVLAFALGISLLAGLLFGLVPALRATETSLVSALKNQADPKLGALRGFGLQGVLVAGQVALSLVSLIAAGLFLRSLGKVQHIDPGFPADKLATIAFDTDFQGWEKARAEQFHRDLCERIAGLPGVAGAALAQAGPFQGAFGRTVFLEGGDASNDGVMTQVNPVGPGYFETIGVRMAAGRAFSEADREGAPRVVIVNETMAKRFWPGQSAVGKRFHFFGDPPVEVVGVARDAKYNNPGEDPQLYAYEPLAQRSMTGMTLIVRSAKAPETVLAMVQKEMRSMAPGLPLLVSTVPDLVRQSLWAPKAGAMLLAAFGLLALVLATIGLYGVMSFSVAQRSREIGMRMALGAREGDVLGLVLRQGLTLVAAGMAAGLLLAAGLMRVASGLLFGVSATDPMAFGATSAVLLLAAFAATLVPALKAVSVPPSVALRYE